MDELLIAGVAGALLGVLLGWLLFGRLPRDVPGRIRRAFNAVKGLVGRSVVPLIVLLVFAGILLGLVRLGKTAEVGHKDVWAMITAVVFLLGVSLLLYTTGVKQYTATRQIDLAGGEPTSIDADAEVSPEQHARLTAEELAKVSERYKATKDFTIPAGTVRFPKGRLIGPEDHEALPDAATKDKFELRYLRTKSPRTTISQAEYDALAEDDKQHHRPRYRAKVDVSYELPALSVGKDTRVAPGHVIHHRDRVAENATLVHIAREPLEVPAKEARIIEKGAPVDPKTYREDLQPEQRALVRKQRGLYFRGLYVGADGRWSTSKLQVLLWTYAVLFGLASLYVFDAMLDQTFDVKPGSETTDGGFGDIALQEQYLLLLGGPFAAAVIAKASTQTKVAEGQVVKTPDTPTAGPVDGLREVISNDAGQTDVMDFQYFFFNILALGIFLVSIVGHLAGGFPDLPWFLVGLTSTSALAYATKKSLEQSRPQITGVVPERVRPGDTLEIKGRHLVTPSRRPPEVALAGDEVPPGDVRVTAGTARDDISTIEITVPLTTKAAAETQLVVVPEGSAVGAERTIEVLGPTIEDVQPASIPAVAGTKVRIFGEGFGDEKPDQLKAALGSLPLEHTQDDAWSDTEIVLTVGAASAPGATVSGNVELRIQIGKVAVARKTVALTTAASSITEVVPSSIELRHKTVVSVVGSGFGDRGEVKIDSWPLDVVTWTDTLIEGTLEVDPVPAGFETEKNVRLLVAPDGRPPIPKDVKVKSTAGTSAITDVLPSVISLSRERAVTVVGSGFGDAASKGTVKIDRWRLRDLSWSDTLIEGTLEVDPVPDGFDDEKTVRLLVAPNGRPSAARDVKVKK